MSERDPREVLNLAGSVIALMLVGLLGFALWALVYVEVPVANNNTLTVLIGILSANIGMVVGFYFGSSSTSKKQQDTIASLALSTAPPIPDSVVTTTTTTEAPKP